MYSSDINNIKLLLPPALLPPLLPTACCPLRLPPLLPCARTALEDEHVCLCAEARVIYADGAEDAVHEEREGEARARVVVAAFVRVVSGPDGGGGGAGGDERKVSRASKRGSAGLRVEHMLCVRDT